MSEPGEGHGGIVEKTENSKSNSSKRRLSVTASLVPVVAVICGGGLWRHRNAVQGHDRCLPPGRASSKTYRAQEGEYR